ncbi:T6SS phospholipase effector Tle1-like catalytic domain-containing protein [Marivita hallyeonensis]|uniref:Uncharacterized protein, PA2063/DUF2235 family n=1 Tax=Marivita hallyeonensis TaxID=996342 RepID=A0A1M5QPY1_9RHOB|nr:DUF2235 domain-containing protein [Marivita hallyeonensis]SHH15839.1 Uncharacterized protein, PA2063/DUF2235 family [Marivita hallyeonensis]
MTAPHDPLPSRRLIICFDGTGNEIEQNESNILRLYKCLEHSDTQLVYYVPGVGTTDRARISGHWLEGFRELQGLVFGQGLEANVLSAFEFLCRNYREGDILYFFGYSRGAYTARVLAGFINQFGLVAPHELHLIRPAFRIYRSLTETDPRKAYADLRIQTQFFHMTHPPIRFLGLWDTVSSMIRLRLGAERWIQFGTHASVNENPSVQAVRHVLSIDERRRLFRPQFWEPGPFYGKRKGNAATAEDQDVKQVWFPGTHTDVAGSVSEAQAGLAKVSFVWMREELDALDTPLAFEEELYRRYMLGEPDTVTKEMDLDFVAPNPLSTLHDQLKKNWAWRALEHWPRRNADSSWPDQKSRPGWYRPRGQHRYIAEDADIHPAAFFRRREIKAYDPANLRRFDG